MKNQRIFILCILLFSSATAFSQNWIWANSGGGGGNSFSLEAATSICNDLDGNIYITGYIQGFSAYFETDTINVNGLYDLFIAKYDNGGNELWVKSFGSASNDPNSLDEMGECILYDSLTNSIYLAGRYGGYCIMGSDTLSGGPIHYDEAFLARFDLEGNCNWAKSVGGIGKELFTKIVISNSGNIYLSGTVSDSSQFGLFTLPGGGYLAMFDSSGNCIWAKNIFNAANNSYGAAGYALDLEFYHDEIYMIAQKLADTVIVDTIMIIEPNIKSAILINLDTLGKVKLAKLIGAPNVYATEMEIDKDGNVYLGFNSPDTMSIFETDTLISIYNRNSFLAKFDSIWNLQWVTQSSASIWISFNDISTDSIGSTYVTGSFGGASVFNNNSIQISTTTEHLFVMRYNSNGSFLGFTHAGQAIGNCIQTLSNGSCAVAGRFSQSLTLGSTTLTSYGDTEVLIAKLDALNGIEDIERKGNQQLYIYANPSTGKCNIKVPDDFEVTKNLILSIYAMNGKLIRQIPIEAENGDIKVNIEAEAKGIYNAILTNGKRSYSGKIIFE